MKLKQTRLNRMIRSNDISTLARLPKDCEQLIKAYQSVTGVSYAEAKQREDNANN